MNKNSLLPAGYDLALVLLLFVSFALRLVLIFKEGHLVHGDGAEYFMHSGQVYGHLLRLDFSAIFASPVPHWGGVLFGAIPFFFSAGGTGDGKISAVFFAIPAVINIFLIYRIALLLDFQRKAALLSAFLYTFSFSTFYQVRHVLLHDLSIFFFLVCIATLLASRQDTRRSLFIGGLMCFLVFFTYFGYWVLATVGLLFITFYRAGSARMAVMNAAVGGAGFVIPFFLLWLACSFNQSDLIKELLHFSGTIRQGSFDEGHTLPFAFSFYSERFLSLVWLACLFFALTQLADRRVRFLCLGILFIYLMLVLGSTVLHYFVVLGRLVKQAIPLLCLLSGLFLCKINSRFITAILLGAIVLGFSWNYSLLYGAMFDSEFEEVYAGYQEKLAPDRTLRRISICEPHDLQCDTAPDHCQLVFSYLPPILNIKYFQYEVLTPEMRANIAGRRIYMQLYNCPRGAQK